MHYDVFNGDADGIFALHQLRLASPVREATLITGIKRDITLLKQIKDAENSTITVLDISLDKNREELEQLLNAGNQVLYIDHHYAGKIPESSELQHHIEPSAKICSSLIVNTLLQGRFAEWAACGAFGDNLNEQAIQLAASKGLSEEETAKLQEIGELFNYNGYGSKIEDLNFHPAKLYHAVKPYSEPLQFYSSTDIIAQLREVYTQDMAKAEKMQNLSTKSPHRLYMLPAASWARRVSGVFSNRKAREKPEAAHAILVENDDGSLMVSVRAPLAARKNADTLCRKFPTGGGRAAAAGINHLPAEMVEEFKTAFHQIFTGQTSDRQ